MRFATWNLWNSDMPRRYPQLVAELSATGADVIALQECTEDFLLHARSALADWPHQVYEAYDGEDEGLAILSRHPIRHSCFLHRCAEHTYAAALHALIDAGSLMLSVTNVHLPWDSVLTRERQAVALQQFIHAQQADHCILMGDFNDTVGSSVDRFFTGLQSLHGTEASPCWNDLARAWSCHTGQPMLPTLDTVHNPRWHGRRSPCAPRIMDRIYLMDSWEEVHLDGLQLFGQAVSPETSLAASDHYGVLADITFNP